MIELREEISIQIQNKDDTMTVKSFPNDSNSSDLNRILFQLNQLERVNLSFFYLN